MNDPQNICGCGQPSLPDTDLCQSCYEAYLEEALRERESRAKEREDDDSDNDES